MANLIKRLTIDDYDDIIRVWSMAGLSYKPNGRDSREMMAVEIKRDYCVFYGSFSDDKMLAVGIAHYDGRRGWINRVAVDPDYRGQGLAIEIIKRCEEFLNGFGEVVICALIENENLPSMGCFEKAGYICEHAITYWTKRPRSDL